MSDSLDSSDLLLAISTYLPFSEIIPLSTLSKKWHQIFSHHAFHHYRLQSSSNGRDLKRLIIHAEEMQSLWIYHYELFLTFPLNFTSLKTLTIEDCTIENYNCFLGSFPGLHQLILKNCTFAIEHMIDFGLFPALQTVIVQQGHQTSIYQTNVILSSALILPQIPIVLKDKIKRKCKRKRCWIEEIPVLTMIC